jgi:hypothetical protein
MPETPFIDLHPDKIPGSGPEVALAAARAFVEESLRRGHKKVRLITGLGIHGDGSPRLRSRVEREVLAPFFNRIESQHYEQGGAVIVLELKGGSAGPGKRYERKREDEERAKAYVQKEERLLVALERLEAAEAYFDEGDLRRCRIKVNQISREFFPEFEAAAADEESLKSALARLNGAIQKLSS